MLRRWQALSPRTRQLVGVSVAVGLTLAIAWVLFVPAADSLARHDVGTAKPALLQTARDAARGRLLTLGAGVFAASALVFTALNFGLLKRTSQKTDHWQQRTYELAEQGQVTDRYTKAIEQLGSGKLDVRIGGIYALERIARDSADDHPTVVEVLAAFIREHSHEQWPPPDHPASREQEPSVRPDVQAAITVIRRRDPSRDIQPIDLKRARLTCANLAGTNLIAACLTGADLTGADLTGVRLNDADLSGQANLTGAHLAVSLRQTSPARSSTAQTSLARKLSPSAARTSARTSPARTSTSRTLISCSTPARTSPVSGGLTVCPLRRAGS